MIDTPNDVAFVGIITLFVLGLIGTLRLVIAIINKKKIKYNFLFVYILLIGIGFFAYNNQKEKISVAFEDNQELLCNSNPKVIISKDKGYIFKNELFIKNEQIIEIEYCEIF